MVKKRVFLLIGGILFLISINLIVSQISFNLEENNNAGYIILENIDYYGYLDINYSFNNSLFIGPHVIVDISVRNETDGEITKTQDFLDINKEGIIKKETLIQTDLEPSKQYYIYFSLSDYPEEYLKYSFSLSEEDSGKQGRNSLKTSYFIVILIIVILILGVILIKRKLWVSSKNIFKKKDKNISDTEDKNTPKTEDKNTPKTEGKNTPKTEDKKSQ